MDPQRFDSLVRALTTGGSRRRLLGALGTLPLVGGAVAAIADVAETAAKGKRRKKGSAEAKRRKQRDQRDRKRGKGKSHATAEACPLCKRLNTRGKCVTDTAVNGQCCTRAGGQSGQCLNGTCWPGACSGPICNEQTCAEGCCDATDTCRIDDDAACGTGGGSCTACPICQTCDGDSGQCLAVPPSGGLCVACQTSADCEVGLVCDATHHVCRSCAGRDECAPLDAIGNRFCLPLADGSGQSRCTNPNVCGCPGTCADCSNDLLCLHTGGGICQDRNLCCPATPAL